jgi:predicted acylesterase/phospholipase RssA
MTDSSVLSSAEYLGVSSVSGMAEKVGLPWPPPPTISLRELLRRIPRGGVALSGGGTRTDFQVGALTYIVERGFDLGVISGASGGAPNAAKVAAGEGTGALDQYWRSLIAWTDLYNDAQWVVDAGPVIALLMNTQSESLWSLVGGSLVSFIGQETIEQALSAAFGPEFAAAYSLMTMLPTIVKLGIDAAAVASVVDDIQSNRWRSILDSAPLQEKLAGSCSTWNLIGRPDDVGALSLSVTMGGTQLQAFKVGADAQLYQAIQNASDWTTWSLWSWVPTGNTPLSLVVVSLMDSLGRIQLFRVALDAGVYQAGETSVGPGATLSGWTQVGSTTFRPIIAAAIDSAGRVRVFGVGQDNSVYGASETAPGSATYGSWTQIGGAVENAGESLAVQANDDGRIQVFLIASGNLVYYAAETTPGGAFSPWTQIGDSSDAAAAIAAAIDFDGFVQVARSDSNGTNVYVARQLLAGYYMGSWVPLLPPPHGAGEIAFGMDGSRRLNLFVIGTDASRTLQHSVQATPGGPWSSWSIVAPGQLHYNAGAGINFTSPFPTQEVYQVITAWSHGKLQAIVRGHDNCVLSVSDVIALVDSSKIEQSGIKLRLSVVSLESGRLRYVTETGDFLDDPAGGAVSLPDAVLASGALPIVVAPVKLQSENYVDGGIRDLLPVGAIIDAGANLVIAVAAGQPVTPAESSFDQSNLFDIGLRALTDIMPNQILQDHLNPPVPWEVPVKRIEVTPLPVNQVIHGELFIDPGLVAISIDYGYMRAYDDLDATPTALQDNPSVALHQNSDAITDLRVSIWAREHFVNGYWLPFEDEVKQVVAIVTNSAPPLKRTPSYDLVPELRGMKWQLKALVDFRRVVLGGRVPPGVDSWWLEWEKHYWTSSFPSPWVAFPPYPNNPVPAADPPLGADNDLLAEISDDILTVAYVVFGGANFEIPGLPWRDFQPGDERRVPDGALEFDRHLPADGTLLQADTDPQIFVTFGGAKFPIPGLPWPGAVPGTSAGAVGGVNIVPIGALDGISTIPVDGTLLITDDPPPNETSFVVFGGAKFEIPVSVLLDLELSHDLGYLQGAFRTIPSGAAAQMADVPRDGTVLKEIHGLDPYVINAGVKARVVGRRRFFELGLFWPDVGILWDHALDAFPDGGLA